MPQIQLPEGDAIESVRLMSFDSAMCGVMASAADTIYNNIGLTLRVREATRFRVALINQCQMCLSFRALEFNENGIDEYFYQHVSK